MKNKVLKTLMIGGLVVTAAVSLAFVSVDAASVYDEYANADYQTLSLETTLTVEEMLNYAIQDEFMAIAEYNAIIEEFGEVMPFVRIIQAEETHVEMLVELFEAYGYTIPEDQSQAAIIIPESITAAIATGIEAEEANIAMYESFLAQENLPEDVRLVFEQLLEASNHHLSAFSKDRNEFRSEDMMRQVRNQFRKMFANGQNEDKGQGRQARRINLGQ